MTADAGAPAPSSPWSPLRRPLFRGLWIASLASNIGTWMQEVGEGWLMTSLEPSPAMVSLVQVARGLPLFLLALPAGALADVLDRRRVLLVSQLWMLGGAAALGLLTLTGRITAWSLLGCAFAIGLGTAINSPAWQATVPELVDRRELPQAVALNSLSFNVARALGPALGGLVIATLGPGANFLLNAASFLGVVAVVAAWRRPPQPDILPSERFLSALRTGARYVRYEPALHPVLVRGGLFVFFGSALWALLPVVARFDLGRGPGGFGALLACFGSGAVLGAANITRVRRRLGADRMALVGTVVFCAALAALAVARHFYVACAAMFAGGGAWLSVLSGFNVAAQLSLPSWVRARAMSAYLLVFYGAIAAGSATWGAVAARTGTRAALGAAALGSLILGLLARARFRLREGDAPDLSPTRHWPAPYLAIEPEPEGGPVLVTIEYRIDPARAAEFGRVMRRVRRSRMRSGAVSWGLWVDASDPGRHVESFVDESWVEHLRHHQRVTAVDRDVEAEARAFHIGPEPVAVSHFLAGGRE